MNLENKTSLILSILICIIFASCGKKIAIKEGKYSLDWEELPYHNQSEDVIVNQLGKPNKEHTFKIYKDNRIGIYRPLVRFLPANKDTIIIKELFWKQGSYLIYYWLIKKDSVWTSVDGIMYDPKHVEF